MAQGWMALSDLRIAGPTVPAETSFKPLSVNAPRHTEPSKGRYRSMRESASFPAENGAATRRPPLERVRLVADTVIEHALSATRARHVNVLIVGARLSGVGDAWRWRDKRSSKGYVVLLQRKSIGGTWDLFRYPGVRSSSDMHTLGYAFRA
jgi:hypothetical protein